MQSKCQRKLRAASVNSPLSSKPNLGLRQHATRNPNPFETLLRAKPINGNKHLHTHKKNFRYGRYKASQQRNTSEAQTRSQRRISTPSLLSTTSSQCFDQATSKTLTQLIDLIGLPVDLQYRYCKLDLQLPVDLAVTTDRSTVPEPPY